MRVARLWSIAMVAATIPLAAQSPRAFVLSWVGDSSQTGYVNRPLRDRLVVRIGLAGNASQIDEATCLTLAVRFTPYLDGKVGVSPALTQWKVRECLAEAVWKLAGETGEQLLEAVVIRRDTVVSRAVRYRATARALPQISFGLAAIYRAIDLDTPRVTQGALDSAGRRVRFQPMVGFEFPVNVSILRRTRYFVGVSLKNPERDLYAGVFVLPIAYGARFEDYPLQLMVGVRFQRITITDAGKSGWNGRLNVAVTTGSTSLLSAITQF